MNALFPDDKIVIDIDFTKKIKIHGNDIFYRYGKQSGISKKINQNGVVGHEFITENGKKYFLTKNANTIPNDYDAVFLIEGIYDKTVKIKRLISELPSEPGEIIKTWDNAFNYKKESRTINSVILGLRPPQLGALHAILAHWSISSTPAIVVMPTGTGKTETMLSLTVAEKLNKILVIVPSDSLRTQITKKFVNLGILKEDKFKIVDYKALNPIVGLLSTSFKTAQDVEEFFNKCNVVVATSSILATCKKNGHEIFEKIIKLSNYLIVDEAHHCEATTWDNIASFFVSQNKPVLKFTATPFRNDKKRLKGTSIYNYPLSLAQKDGSFKEINFVPIIEFNEDKVHPLIADRAIQQLKEDRETKKLDHFLMARVDDIEKAEEIFKLYEPFSEYSPVLIHSETKNKSNVLTSIKKGKHKIIVCVNMLGEGFDLPELKICALHVIHKNITTSIQFFGRFTRSSSKNVGNATIIANIGDSKLKDSLLRKLYAKDADWNRVLKTSNEGILKELNYEESFFQKFIENEIPYKIPLRNIKPALSTVVYDANNNSTWSPENHKMFFEKKKCQSVFAVHQEKNLLVIISRNQSSVKWGIIDDLINNVYDLYIVYYNEKQKLLFINSSDNGSLYNNLADLVLKGEKCLINESDIYKSLYNIEQLELFNLGVKPISEESISYTQLFGKNVGDALDDITKQTKSSANLFGKGFSDGNRMTIGCSSKGRVWSRMVKTIPEFCDWCDEIGTKLNNPNINVKDIFQFIEKPIRISTLPQGINAISIMWNDELYYRDTELLINDTSFHDYRISILYSMTYENTITFSIKDSYSNKSIYCLTLLDNKNTKGYKYSHISGDLLKFSYGKNIYDTVEDFFTDFPPIVRFNESSKMYNDIFFKFKYEIKAYDSSKIQTKDWLIEGVNIKKESQYNKSKTKIITDSIQHHQINVMKKDFDYKLIFDDDDKNEVSDIIGFKYFEDDYSKLIVDLFHCKYSQEEKTGGRLADLYEVCGQAQRSFHWKHKAENLITHIKQREQLRTKAEKPTRFCLGGANELLIIQNMIESGMSKLIFNIHIVQPGVSIKKISDEQLKLLGATEMLLKNTGNNFNVLISV